MSFFSQRNWSAQSRLVPKSSCISTRAQKSFFESGPCSHLLPSSIKEKTQVPTSPKRDYLLGPIEEHVLSKQYWKFIFFWSYIKEIYYFSKNLFLTLWCFGLSSQQHHEIFFNLLGNLNIFIGIEILAKRKLGNNFLPKKQNEKDHYNFICNY